MSELAALKPLELLSNKASDWHELSVGYGKSGKYEKASQAARTAIELDPENVGAWRSLSINSRKLHDVGSQLAALKSLASLSNKADDWHQLSVLYGTQGRHSDSECAARKAIDVEPKHKQATGSLVLALLAQGKFDEAKKYGDSYQVERVLVFRKIDPLKGESKRAVVKFLKGVIDQNPNDIEYWQVLGASLRKLAVELCDEEGDMLNARLHFEEAIAAHNAALAMVPENIEPKKVAPIWYAKGRAFLELGNSVDACICFKEALGLNPDHLAAGRYYREKCGSFEADISEVVDS